MKKVILLLLIMLAWSCQKDTDILQPTEELNSVNLGGSYDDDDDDDDDDDGPVCNSPTVFLGSSIISPGSPECEFGGEAQQFYADNNCNGTFDQGDDFLPIEIVCNTTPCSAPTLLLSSRTEPPSPECPAGFLVEQFYIDNNCNGVYDVPEIILPEEITCPSIPCNSPTVFLGESNIDPGSPECPLGGVARQSYVDNNCNGTFDQGDDPLPIEIVCN